MLHHRRHWMFCLLALAGLSASTSQAQDKALRIVVPFGPGGGSDNFARILQPKLAELLKQTVIIDNRPGAGGTIGAAFVAKSAPDGQTVLLADAGVATISPALFGKLPYAATDLVPVINLAQFPHVLVSAPGFPAQSMADLLALEKARPGKLSVASSGNGTSPHMTVELLNQVAGTQFVHIPFKGSGPAINDTVGGQVDMVFTGYATVAGLIRAGKLKVIAVTSPRRSTSAAPLSPPGSPVAFTATQQQGAAAADTSGVGFADPDASFTTDDARLVPLMRSSADLKGRLAAVQAELAAERSARGRASGRVAELEAQLAAASGDEARKSLVEALQKLALMSRRGGGRRWLAAAAS